MHDSTAITSHTGGKASKKKRDDRKQYSKRAMAGTTSSRIRKSDNEAGNRYCQALDQAELARVCREANPNIEHTAAPRHGSSGPWVPLKANNIAQDVRQDGIEPSKWNKSSVNGSAIQIMGDSNGHIDDGISFRGHVLAPEEWDKMTKEEIHKHLMQFHQHEIAARNTRGEAGWKPTSERIIYNVE